MEDDVFEAEVYSDHEVARLNLTIGSTVAIAIVFLLIAISFGQIITNEESQIGSDEWWQTPLHERHKMNLDLSLIHI